MSLTQLDITLQSALQDFGLRELPPEWNPNGDTTLVDGIALAVKSTGNEYCKVANKDGKISIVRDYGKCAAIHRIDKIFAVHAITKFDIPRFKTDDEIIHYLCKSKYDQSEIESLLKSGDREEIQRRINEVALSYQKKKYAEEARVKKMKELAESAKATKTQKANGRKKK